MEKATHVESSVQATRTSQIDSAIDNSGNNWRKLGSVRIEAELGLLPWHPALLATFESALRRIGEFEQFW